MRNKEKSNSTNTVIDAWGKFPSGFLEGNFYEFGSFSECFNIQRETESYNTKYCLGQIVLHLDGISSSKSHQYNAINNILPNVWQMSADNYSRPLPTPFFVQQ